MKYLLLLLLGCCPVQALTCTVSATALSFTPYSPMSGTYLDSNSSVVTVQCSTLVGLFISFDVQLSTGLAPTYFPRRMSSGAHTLDYNIFTDAARSSIWGTGTGGTSKNSYSALIGVGTITRNYNAYGRIANQPAAYPGNYTDSITVTVYY